jgi:hypothetical protein
MKGNSMQRRSFLISVLASGFALTIGGPALAQFGQSDARTGLREALSLAARLATDRLGQRNGFLDDPQVHIPLPRSISRVQSQLRRVGLSGSIDDLEVRINHAAEAAMPAAKQIFLNAIRSITVSDAISIVRGGDTAATRFLRDRTQGQLTQLLRPSMESALTSSGAYQTVEAVEPHLQSGRNLLSRFGFGRPSATQSLRESVTDHAVEKALDGAFYYIGQEEQAIRRDPVRQTTSILRRIFG